MTSRTARYIAVVCTFLVFTASTSSGAKKEKKDGDNDGPAWFWMSNPDANGGFDPTKAQGACDDFVMKAVQCP